MQLRSKFYLTIIIPFLLLTVFHSINLQRVIYQYEETLKITQNSEAGHVAREIDDLIKRLERTVINLSKPEEISKAVEGADN